MLRLKRSCRTTASGHHEIALPFKDGVSTFPNNIMLAVKRLESLKRKFLSNEKFHTDYCTFMSDVINKGYAEKVHPEDKFKETGVYIPHHGIYHH